METIFKILNTFLVLSMLTACQTMPQRVADLDIEDAHSGGALIRFDQSNQTLASGGWEGLIKLRALPDGKVIHAWQAHDDSVNGIVFIKQGKHIISAGYDGHLKHWARHGYLVKQRLLSSPITDMLLDESKGLVMTAHADGSVQRHRLSDFKPLKHYQVHKGAVRALTWHSKTQQLASSGHDGRIVIIDRNDNSRQLPSPATDAWSLAFTPDGTYLFGSGWFDLFSWQLKSGKLSVIDTPHRGIIKEIQFAQQGQVLATISRQTDSSVYYLEPFTGKIVKIFQRHELCGEHIRVSPNGRYLASSSDDASLRVWDLNSDKQ